MVKRRKLIECDAVGTAQWQPAPFGGSRSALFGLQGDAMSSGLPDVIGTTIETVFTFAGLELASPIAGLAASSLAAYLNDRYRGAKVILMSELRRAGASAADFKNAEEFAAAAFRYARAVRVCPGGS